MEQWMGLPIVGGMLSLCLWIIRIWLAEKSDKVSCEGKDRLLREKIDNEKKMREVRDKVIEDKLGELKDTFEKKVDEQKDQSAQMLDIMSELLKEVKKSNGGNR
jgi:CRISPR/Cas system CMR subunit Cmr6 (Cas7 group RAMP superfamily)